MARIREEAEPTTAKLIGAALGYLVAVAAAVSVVVRSLRHGPDVLGTFAILAYAVAAFWIVGGIVARLFRLSPRTVLAALSRRDHD